PRLSLGTCNVPKLSNPLILQCRCGDSLYLYDEDDRFRFQHGENPEHSYVGPKLDDELLPKWRKGPDILIEIRDVDQIDISGNWIDALHSPAPSVVNGGVGQAF